MTHHYSDNIRGRPTTLSHYRKRSILVALGPSSRTSLAVSSHRMPLCTCHNERLTLENYLNLLYGMLLPRAFWGRNDDDLQCINVAQLLGAAAWAITRTAISSNGSNTSTTSHI
jgi:hypothetical protein